MKTLLFCLALVMLMPKSVPAGAIEDAAKVAAILAALPPSDTGLGFFFDRKRGKTAPEDCFRTMAAAGCNTVTVYYTSVEDVARQVDAAIEAGCLDTRFPVFLVSDCAIEPLAAIQGARALAQHPWPKFMVYGPDEPQAENESGIIAFEKQAHEWGLPWGTAIESRNPWLMTQYMDAPILGAEWLSDALLEKVHGEGSEFRAYTAQAMQRNENMVRYYTGLWRWKAHPVLFLAWDYWSYIGKPGMTGWREGALDYRVLCALEEKLLANPRHPQVQSIAHWLQSVKDRISLHPFASIPGCPPWALVDKPSMSVEYGDPPVGNLEFIRAQALQYLADLTD